MNLCIWPLIICVLFLICDNVFASDSCNASDVNIAFPSKVKECVSIEQPVVHHFSQTKNQEGQWDLVKFTIGLADPTDLARIQKYPIGVTVHAKGAIMSFALPFGPENQYYHRETWICPNPGESSSEPVASEKPSKGKKKHKAKGKDESKLPHDVVALTTITTLSFEPIMVKTATSTMSMNNFLLIPDGKVANVTPKSSESLVKRVNIPHDVGSVRITADSNNDMCAVLAVQSMKSCPFITSEDYERAYRRLTFTRHGSMIIKRDEMDSFYVVVFPLPDDKVCGQSGPPIHGRPDQKKSITVGVSTVPSALTHYAFPIILTFIFYGVFFVAVAPIKIIQALTGNRTRQDNEQGVSIRGDEDALMHDSVSRCVSPKPIEQGRSEPETGQLIAITSASASVVNEGEGLDPFAVLERRQEIGTALATTSADQCATKQLVEVDKGIEAMQVEEMREMGPTGHHDIQQIPPSQSSPSDVSCVLASADGHSAGNTLDLDTPTRSYAWIHAILCGFLLLVVIQQIAWVYPKFATGGDMDICYYNSRCGAPLGSINAFNHTVSNIGFFALGVLALLILRKRYQDYKKELQQKGSGYVHSFGLPTHFGMMTALGIGMASQGLLSAIYHQCPNSSTIQFESINVYLTALLTLLKLYGSRHEPTQAHVAYGVAFAFWTLATISSITDFAALWWISFCIVELILMPLLSLQVYYHGHVAYSMASLKVAKQSIERVLWAELKRGNWKPLFGHRLTALFFVNVFNILTSVIVAATSTMTISEYILSGLIINLIIYFIYYLGNKINAKETIQKMNWFYLAAALLFWIAALKYFFTATIDWKMTPAQSRALNQSCTLFGFYDSHDLWHLLSSVALFFSFMSLLTLDDDLKGKRRRDIAVF